jgi:hypothetical protein
MTLLEVLDAIVVPPPTVTSTPLTDTAKLGVAKRTELAASVRIVRIRVVFFI